MARFRMNNIGLDPRMQRQALQNKFTAARMNLLAIVVFTLINIFALATNAGSYFLFSASVPYVITLLAMLMCGMLPPEIYEDLEGMFFLDESLFYVALVIALLIVALYLVCFFFSKKKPVWLTVALVLFIIDTAFMFLYYGFSLDMIFDIAFHGWVIWILVSGVKAEKELRKMPKPEAAIEADYTELPGEEMVQSNMDNAGSEIHSIESPAPVFENATEEAATEASVAEENVTDEPAAKEEKPEENDSFSAAKGPLDI